MRLSFHEPADDGGALVPGLRGRGETMTELTAALEASNQPQEVRTALDLIERSKPQLAKLLGTPEAVERLARTVTTEMRRVPKLFECSAESLVGAMFLAGQLGLEPGPLGHVYLVPFKGQVEFIVGYKGFCDLAYRSGQVKDIAAGIVYEGDLFEWREGSRPFLDHTPSGPAGEREATHFYALARLRTGGVVSKVLFPEDIEKAQKRSPAGSKGVGPWVTDWAAMARKTPIRRLASGGGLPVTNQLARALNVDEHAAVWVEGTTDGALEIVEGGNES